METLFNVTCHGWQVSYRGSSPSYKLLLRRGKEKLLISYGPSSLMEFLLPAGEKDNGYKLVFYVEVADLYHYSTRYVLNSVKVNHNQP